MEAFKFFFLASLYIVLSGIGIHAQVASYSFDDCTATDNSGNGADGVISGMPECNCGISGEGLHFNGTSDYVQFLGDFDILFTNNFSISFYMNPEQLSGTVDILSKREMCSSDQSVAIKYLADSRTIIAEISENVGNLIRNTATLPDNRCWHHVVWVRNNTIHRLYINGEQVDEEFSQNLISVAGNGIFSIANSPCLMNGELRFQGTLDELQLFNQALTTPEVQALYLPVDEILSQDTIMFIGTSLQVNLPLTCADQVSWSPSDGVDMPDMPEPVITPLQTTTYQVNLNYGHCIATDTLSLIVVDSSQLQCEQIYFPRAFTPNEDGLNDIFKISNTAFLGEFISFNIYDRWGGEVFVAQTYNDGWDGNYQGEPVIPGMYVYKFRFTCEGEEKLKIGSLTLMR